MVAHDFKPGRGVQVVNPTTAGSADDPAILQWADPLGHARDDDDLYALDALGNVVAFSSGPLSPSETTEPGEAVTEPATRG
jgi:hypothetical protein